MERAPTRPDRRQYHGGPPVTRTLALLLAAAAFSTTPATAQPAPAATAQAASPLFAAEIERAKADVEASIRADVNVPVPKDPGGGFTH